MPDTNYYDNNLGATFWTDVPSKTGAKGYHTKRDFAMYPVSKPVVAPPEAKTQIIDIPGTDGTIDLTQTLTGDVHYNDREITMEYKIPDDRSKWDPYYHKMLNAIHGQRMYLVLDEDPAGFYDGRFAVGEPRYENNSAYFTITGQAKPYRLNALTSLDPWLWDPFSFVDGIIRYYVDIAVNGTKAVRVVGSAMPTTPDIILKSGSLTVTYPVAGGTKTVTLEAGSNLLNTPDLILHNGVTVLTFNGTGVVSISYRTGDL